MGEGERGEFPDIREGPVAMSLSRISHTHTQNESRETQAKNYYTTQKFRKPSSKFAMLFKYAPS